MMLIIYIAYPRRQTMTNENPATTPLTLEVYTTPTRTFVSASTPEGPGDEPTWSPSSATLIYG